MSFPEMTRDEWEAWRQSAVTKPIPPQDPKIAEEFRRVARKVFGLNDPGSGYVAGPTAVSGGKGAGGVVAVVDGRILSDGTFDGPKITMTISQPAAPAEWPVARLPARAFILPIDGRAPRV